MKKILGLSTLALAGVLAFTGCGKGMSEEEALKYAEEQGYLNAEAALKYAEEQGYVKTPAPEQLSELPAPRLTEDGCTSNTFTLACSNVNKTNLYQYLNRSDVVYLDVRDFKAYEAEHLEGFSNIQFFADIYDQSSDKSGTQLFNVDYTPKYKDSAEILKGLFPQDKTLFIMCQSGGRVVHLMKILELNGYDMSKVYNVGGMNDYNKEAVAEHYGDLIVARSTAALTFTKGTDTHEYNGHPYITTAYVSVDTNNKITNVYVTGTVEYTTGSTTEWTQDTWLNGKYEYCKSLVGKTLADIQAMLGEDGAEGSDVLAGATVTSNRVLRAVVDALDGE